MDVSIPTRSSQARLVAPEPPHQPRSSKLSLEKFGQAAFFALALVSLIYALATSTRIGIDLQFFQQGAREWLDGLFRIGDGVIGEYPPFAIPLLSPIAYVSFNRLLVIWLILTLVSAAVSFFLVLKLWGSRWPLRVRLYLGAFLITWAPFRVTLRNGQITFMIMALLLGALLARQKKRGWFAGVLLGLSLAKYSLTFPFFLYFVWRREWKILTTAILIPVALTQVFAWRMGLSMFEVIGQYTRAVSHLYFSGFSVDVGTTEIKLLFLGLSGGNESFAVVLSLVLTIAAMVCMAIVFSKKPRLELEHFSALALFSLWSVYHRTYDSILCLLPAATLVGFLVQRKLVAFSRFWLAGLGLLILSVPGVLVDRLKISPEALSNNPLLMLGVHIERLLVFGMFWSLMFVMWRTIEPASSGRAESSLVEQDSPISSDEGEMAIQG